MSILYSGDLKVPREAQENFAEYFFKKFREHPEHILLIDGNINRKYSRKWMLQQTYRYVKLLAGQALRPGDVVGLCSENSVEMACIVYAALYLGLTLSPWNFMYTQRELEHMIQITRPKVIIVSPLAEAVVAKAAQASTGWSPLAVVAIGSVKRTATRTTVELFSETAQMTLPPIARVDQRENVAGIFASSGTTGPAKGVAVTQNALMIDLMHEHKIFTVPPHERKMLTFVPWFHIMGFFNLYHMPWTTADVVFLSGFEPSLYLSSIERYKITTAVLVPPIVVFLAKSPLVADYDLSSLREIYSGAAPLQAETVEAIYKRLPSVQVVRQGYGMTEGLVLLLPPMPPQQKLKSGSVGLLAEGTYCKVINPETGEILGPNKAGELCFRGPQLMKGYYNNEKATRETIDETGWMHTGDVGYYDEEGYFFIVDRLKELIKYKGFQVPPAELESLLLTHPQVKDAAVIGVPDERAGELPLAFIVRQPVGQDEKQVTGEDLVRFVADQNSPAKRLHGGVRFIEEIPKNPSGKILRRVLRELVHSNREKAKL